MLKPSLQLRLGQQLTMTPQLQQAIRLLQMPALELQAHIRELLESNVMLEPVDDADATSGFEALETVAPEPAVTQAAAADQDAPVEVVGPVKMILHAASSAPDTDWTAKLVDVAPCGFARNLTDGILRARFRNSMAEGEPITPNAAIEYEIDMWATANVFQKGHRIRLEVSSSNFPRFDRNMNTGNAIGEDSSGLPAQQTIFHRAGLVSYIDLPVVPGGKAVAKA